jgi:hypothetical protein
MSNWNFIVIYWGDKIILDEDDDDYEDFVDNLGVAKLILGRNGLQMLRTFHFSI